MKKIISKNERLQIVGLMTIARQYSNKLDEVTKAMNEIVGSEDELGSLLSDAVFDESSVDRVLKNMNILVK